jgi:Protein of unknown function, DUF547
MALFDNRARRAVRSVRVMTAGVTVLIVALLAARGGAARQEAPAPGTNVDAIQAPLDRLLDVYVRDGFVYYRALKSDRAKLDRYIASLDVPQATYDAWPKEQQMAFWINAYNAMVLQTVVDHYPIHGRAAEYPANSLRQVPGAFERLPHRVLGRTLTLDAMEKEMAGFKEPQALLALGRGAIGGGRLHSEAYTSQRLAEQLKGVSAECVQRKECVQIEANTGTLSVSPLFSWREAMFIDPLGVAELKDYPGRSPIERAVLRLIEPYILPTEQEFLKRNTFKISYHTFDWRLNDLTGGIPNR